MSINPPFFDTKDPSFTQDPYSYYKKLRLESDLTFSEKLNGWVVHRYDDIEFFLKNTQLTKPGNKQNKNIGSWKELFNRKAAFSDLLMKAKGFTADWMVSLDSNKHKALRKAIGAHFNSKSLGELKVYLEEIAEQTILNRPNKKSLDIMDYYGK
jgi:cytochrome P450